MTQSYDTSGNLQVAFVRLKVIDLAFARCRLK